MNPTPLPLNRAILISSLERTVKEVQVSCLHDLYRLIGCDMVECPTATIGGVEQDLWCDEEGLMKSPQHFVKVMGFHQPIAGSIVIMGTDKNGIMEDAKVTVEQVKAEVEFLTRAQSRHLYGV